MAFIATHQSALLILRERKRAEGDSLVELHLVADNRGPVP
jgi:hypothetical protein